MVWGDSDASPLIASRPAASALATSRRSLNPLDDRRRIDQVVSCNLPRAERRGTDAKLHPALGQAKCGGITQIAPLVLRLFAQEIDIRTVGNDDDLRLRASVRFRHAVDFRLEGIEIIGHAVEHGAPMTDVRGGRDRFADF